MASRIPWVGLSVGAAVGGIIRVGLAVCFLAAAFGAVTASVPGASAAEKAGAPATEIALPEPLTKETIRELVARLSDDEVRRLLLAQLDRAATTSAQAPPEGMGAVVSGAEADAGRLRARFVAVLGTAPQLPAVVPFALTRLSEGRGPSHLLLVAVLLGALLGLAWGAERLFLWLIRDARARLEETAAPTVVAQAGRLLVRLALALVALLVFAGTVVVVFVVLYQGHEPTRRLVTAVLATTVFIKLASRLSHFLLAPAAPALRLVPFDDVAARRLHTGVLGFATFAVVTLFGVGLLEHLGIDRDLAQLLWIFSRLLAVGILMGIVWQNRAPVGALIRGAEASGLRRVLAEAWPVLAFLYLLFLGGLLTVENLAGREMLAGVGLWSILVVVAMPLADRALCALVTGTAPAPGPDAPAAGGAVFGPVLRRGVHIGVTVAGLLLLARLWRLDFRGMAENHAGAWATGALIDVAVLLLLASLAWEVLRTAIDQRIQAEGGTGGGAAGEEGGEGASRLRTVLPILRMFAFATVVVLTAMLVLSALGMNIGPLMAGAGVVGLAIGFGTQTLVRDVVSGAFFLADDAFRLGEYIEAGGIKGVVEKIGLRSMQVRHHRGPLHTLPYGQIQRLTNNSRDWVIMKLEFRLTYDTDLLKVKKIFRKIGEELSADPEMGPSLLTPLKSQGIMATEDSALVVRAKFTAKPGSAPYVIQREAYTRIIRAFKENGIQFAHRQVTVFTAPGDTGAAPAAAAGGAAARAIAAEEAEAEGRRG
jgi:small-conductance mechanosensitive channel